MPSMNNTNVCVCAFVWLSIVFICFQWQFALCGCNLTVVTFNKWIVDFTCDQMILNDNQ